MNYRGPTKKQKHAAHHHQPSFCALHAIWLWNIIAIVTRRWNVWYVAAAVPNNNRCEFTHKFAVCFFVELSPSIWHNSYTHTRVRAEYCENATKYVCVCVCLFLSSKCAFGPFVFLCFYLFVCVTVITVECLKLLLSEIKVANNKFECWFFAFFSCFNFYVFCLWVHFARWIWCEPKYNF